MLISYASFEIEHRTKVHPPGQSMPETIRPNHQSNESKQAHKQAIDSAMVTGVKHIYYSLGFGGYRTCNRRTLQHRRVSSYPPARTGLHTPLSGWDYIPSHSRSHGVSRSMEPANRGSHHPRRWVWTGSGQDGTNLAKQRQNLSRLPFWIRRDPSG